MADPVAGDLRSKLVQEIAQGGASGGAVPERYVHKNRIPKVTEGGEEVWKEKLMIDLSLLSSESEEAAAELAKFRSALSEWGCFLVVNHGMTNSFLEELLEVTRQFFALPFEEMQKYSSPGQIFQGYGSDSGLAGNQTLGWNDRLYVILYPEEKRMLHLGPLHPSKLRELSDKYAKKLTMILEVVLKAMARSLDLVDEDRFLDLFGRHQSMVARFNLVPRCLSPDQVMGFKPHSDGSTITFLLPDYQVEALQVQKDDQWFKVPIIPGALFLNLGDLAEVMTNGIFKATVHRVMTNSERDRVSVAVFCNTKIDKEIGPINELLQAHGRPLYQNLTVKKYGQLFLHNYPLGLRTLETLKI